MDLSRAIGRFAKNDIYGWNSDRQCFEWTGKKGSLQVYDRFISDRTFGTKKRVLLLPRQDYIPYQYEYIRVGNSLAKFMVDALNEDVYADTPYANSYLLRECKFKVEIGFLQGQTRASGSGGKSEFVVESALFGDYERYKNVTSKEFDSVDYTVSDIFLPLSAKITSAHLLRIDGKLYNVSEVSRVSNLLWVRAQKMEEDLPPVNLQETLYTCEAVCKWDSPDLVVGSYSGLPHALQFVNPCQSLLVRIDYNMGAGLIDLALTGIPTNVFVYNSEKELQYTLTGPGNEQFTSTPEAGWFIAVTPANPYALGAAGITITD